MVTSKLLTIREAAHYLNITEKEVIELSDAGVIPAYKVGGVYLRFRREQLEEVKPKIEPNQSLVSLEGTLPERVADFLYQHDFTIVSLAAIFFLLYLIARL